MTRPSTRAVSCAMSALPEQQRMVRAKAKRRITMPTPRRDRCVLKAGAPYIEARPQGQDTWDNPAVRLAPALIAAATLAGGFGPALAEDLSAETASRLAGLALECVHKEYPNKIAHVMDGDGDAQPPRKLTPAFFGCSDWHASVHGHWLLVRLIRLHPEASFARDARGALAASLTPENLTAEAAYLSKSGRETFERPYGLAWLLALSRELAEWDDPDARAWSAALAPLTRAAVSRLSAWLPKLAYPIREGEHNQTAFAFGLILDWARSAGDRAMEELVVSRTKALYLADNSCPLDYEPSGQDFLSPCLAEADLMRRILPPTQFASWLKTFLPGIPRNASKEWLPIGVVTDRSDGKLVHLDGLNLSRAWMLEGIVRGLPAGDSRIPALRAAAARHRAAGLSAVTEGTYAGGHWLGTFATYLVTGRGY